MIAVHRGRSLLVGVAVGLVAALAPVLPADRARAADSLSPLGLDHEAVTADVGVGGDLLIAADGRSLVTTAADGGIVELSLTGALLHASGGDRLSDLAMGDGGSTYYGVTSTGAEVVAYDAQDLDEVARVAVPGGHGSDVEVAGGRVWVAREWSTPGLGSFDVDLEEPFVPAVGIEGRWSSGPNLRAAAPGVPALWVRASSSGGTNVLERLALDGSSVTATATATFDRTYDGDPSSPFAVAPGGTSVIAGTKVLDGTTLATIRALDGAQGKHDWAVAPSGQVLGIALAPEEETLVAWSPARPAPVGWWGRNPRTTIWWSPSGAQVVVSPDGRSAYAFTGDVLMTASLEAEPGWLSLDPAVPRTGAGTRPVTGALDLPDGSALVGHLVTVERVGPAGAALVGAVLTGPGGRFGTVDLLAPEGPATYRARWAGDARHPSGAIALQIPQGATMSPSAPRAGESGPDRAIAMRPLSVRELVTDDVHRRLFAMGNQRDNTGTELHPQPRIDVYSYSGALETSLSFDAPANELTLTPDGTHLLVPLPDLGRIEVLDAATLHDVGTIPTAPLQTRPTDLAAVGTDVWVMGTGSDARTIRLPLASPGRLRHEIVSATGGSSGSGVWTDPARPGRLYTFGDFGGAARWDATVSPVVRETAPSSSSPPVAYPSTLVLPRNTGPIRTIGMWGGITEWDPNTFQRLRDRGGQSPGNVTSAADGPSPEQFVSGFADTYGYEGGVAVWADGDAPVYVYDLERGIQEVAVSADGSLAFAVDGGNWQEGGEPEGTLIVLHHPFARCRVTLTVPAGPLRGLAPVTVTGRVVDRSGAGRAAPVQVTLGGGSSSVVADADGRFRAVVTPTELGSTEVRATTSADGGCEASQALELLALPSGPVPFGSTEEFVARQVRDVLRVDSPADVTAALAAFVDDGTVTPDELTAWLVVMSDPVEGALARLYLTAVGRWPTAAELDARVASLVGGVTLDQIAASLGSTAAFRARFGTGSDDSFVTNLYRTTLNRAPSTRERAARLAELARGDKRGVLALRLAQTGEVAGVVGPYLLVELTYLGLFQRNAIPAETTAMVQALANGASYPDLVRDLRTSTAYAQRIAALGS